MPLGTQQGNNDISSERVLNHQNTGKEEAETSDIICKHMYI